MFITKCDICEKEIDHRNKVDVRFAWTEKADLCESCATPILNFLKKKKKLKKYKFMAKNENPLTLGQLKKYNKEVLFPFMKESFVTKKEFESFMEIAAKKEDLDGLAVKVNGLVTKEDVKILNKKLDSISEDLKKNNKLETRILDIENILDMPAIKK